MNGCTASKRSPVDETGAQAPSHEKVAVKLDGRGAFSVGGPVLRYAVSARADTDV